MLPKDGHQLSAFLGMTQGRKTASSKDTLPSRGAHSLSMLGYRGLSQPPKLGNSARPSQLQSMLKGQLKVSLGLHHGRLLPLPNPASITFLPQGLMPRTLPCKPDLAQPVSTPRVGAPLGAREAPEKEVESTQLMEGYCRPKG